MRTSTRTKRPGTVIVTFTTSIITTSTTSTGTAHSRIPTCIATRRGRTVTRTIPTSIIATLIDELTGTLRNLLAEDVKLDLVNHDGLTVTRL